MRYFMTPAGLLLAAGTLGALLTAEPAFADPDIAPESAPAPVAAEAPAAGATTETAAQPPPVEQRLKELEDTVRELREEIRRLRTAPAQPNAAQVEKIIDERLKKEKPLAGWDNGFFLQSPDGGSRLRIRGYIQSDARVFTSSGGRTGVDNFFLRRVRPIFEGTINRNIDFRLMPSFDEGRAAIQDAYADIRFQPSIRLRAGKFKAPLSVERLQSGADLLFVERSLVNNLSPVRDTGVQLHGDLLGGRLNYALAAFNGVGDGGSSDGDTASDKDFVGRVFAEPFKNRAGSPLQGLGFGVAGSIGRRDGETLSSVYRTAGRSQFFKYGSDVTGVGEQRRLAPQFYYFRGPLGVMGEHITSTQEVGRGGRRAEFENDGWFVQGSYVLTGENATYRGSVSPRNAFDPQKGKWGAVELAARYSRINFDDRAFSLGFADSKTSASGARAFTIGMNWYLNRWFKLQLNYERTDFNRGITFGEDRRDHEDVFISRFQVSF